MTYSYIKLAGDRNRNRNMCSVVVLVTSMARDGLRIGIAAVGAEYPTYRLGKDRQSIRLPS